MFLMLKSSYVRRNEKMLKFVSVISHWWVMVVVVSLPFIHSFPQFPGETSRTPPYHLNPTACTQLVTNPNPKTTNGSAMSPDPTITHLTRFRIRIYEPKFRLSSLFSYALGLYAQCMGHEYGYVASRNGP